MYVNTYSCITTNWIKPTAFSSRKQLPEITGVLMNYHCKPPALLVWTSHHRQHCPLVRSFGGRKAGGSSGLMGKADLNYSRSRPKAPMTR